jgi:hypothetical protein
LAILGDVLKFFKVLKLLKDFEEFKEIKEFKDNGKDEIYRWACAVRTYVFIR